MENLRTANKVVGLKQSRKAVQKGCALRAYVAEDADPWIVRPLVDLCEEHEVPVVQAPTMKELAKSCHVEVPTACAVLLKHGEENR